MAATREYESEVVAAISTLAGQDETILDVGANIGLIAIGVLQKRPDVSVVSFEPSPNSLRYLRATWGASDFRERWRIVEKACGETNRVMPLRLASEEDGAFDSFVETKRVPYIATCEVDVVTLDWWWSENGRPAVSVVKIDVEGSESIVLKGMSRILAECDPVVVLEWNLKHISIQEQNWLIDFCASSGRKLVEISSGAPVTSLTEIRIHLGRGSDTFLFFTP